ncbi:MAG: heme biosynthesis HemY N-terminal domain-containing protein [Alphaproteobacteria bacterium]
MIRSIIYIIKAGLLVVAAVWLADRPGIVNIEWQEYTIRMKAGFFLAALFVIITLGIFIYGLIRTLVNLPRTWRRYREITRRDKGYRALALGLTAVAAGDARSASRHAHRAIRFLPKGGGMPLLLLAQAERLKGNEQEARRIFNEMLQNKDTAFLGVRGLLQGALEEKDYERALGLAQHGLDLYPKQKWVLRIAYDLEIRLRHWDAARKVLSRAERAGAIEKDEARSDRVAMVMAEGEELLRLGMRGPAQKKFYAAYKMDPYFAPAVLALTRLQKYDGHRKRAAKLTKRAWERTGHAALAELWMEMKDTAKNNDPLARLKWSEELLETHPHSADAHLVVAEAAVEAALWGEARDHLQKAEDVTADARVFRLRAEIERRAFQDDSEAVMWLKKAENAPEPRSWVCRMTGRVYESWHAIALPHGSFNTITWDFPGLIPGMASLPTTIPADPVIEAPLIFRV